MIRLLTLQALVGWLAERNYRAVPELEAAGTADAGRVSIVVPARDEAHRLPRLLHSLAALDYPEYEVVVVDDASSDGTGDIARSAGVRVLRVDGPPAGWTGKCYACHAGAGITDSPWILFTDADTVHAPSSLGYAMAQAVQYECDLVSVLAAQECRTFWERLLLPYAYALYFAGAIRINRPHGTPVANGQYMLFRRDFYDRIGGHASVRGSLVEDVALAALCLRHAGRVRLFRTALEVRVRMYDTLCGLWEGFSKNAFRFVTASPLAGAGTVVAGLALDAALPSALSARGPRRLVPLLVPAIALVPWLRRFGVPAGYALLHPLAAAVFQILALDSMRRTAIGGATRWRGRRY